VAYDCSVGAAQGRLLMLKVFKNLLFRKARPNYWSLSSLKAMQKYVFSPKLPNFLR